VDQKIKTFCTFSAFQLFGFSAFRPRRPPFGNVTAWNLKPNSRRRSLIDASCPISRRRPGQQLNNNYGREAAAFLKARQNNGTLLDNWEQQLGPRSGRLLEFCNQPSGVLQPLGTNNYSREAAAFLKATNNNNYGREAAAFLKASKAK
jgi:hypothetical protein